MTKQTTIVVIGSLRVKQFSAFITSDIFGTMYFRVLKSHICIGYEKLGNPYLFSFPLFFVLLYL